MRAALSVGFDIMSNGEIYSIGGLSTSRSSIGQPTIPAGPFPWFSEYGIGREFCNATDASQRSPCHLDSVRREAILGRMTNDIITLVANVDLTLSFIVGLVFGIAQFRAGTRDRRDRLTLKALQNFQSRDFAELLPHFDDCISNALQWQTL
jgi:hypothetical protein